ncbi:class II aaRS and biotin synthetase [Dothidotthia symphoricarpi CBS 119687]|uniref:aspartate--tRNA ligase n=1 Tax=Dothidotthia symphoricarpi CBS 119687 TaxID=1392245 RepID=A0A6A5ZX01_9PLEO|nr:class II aaRS and biotin synthetase [Dothidotthia symphoricarpi CBS 119687]KAF2123423.1 class II aaRS and biotin synthetase [Dothidotthia symphoricarpi CBS 119687]
MPTVEDIPPTSNDRNGTRVGSIVDGASGAKTGVSKKHLVGLPDIFDARVHAVSGHDVDRETTIIQLRLHGRFIDALVDLSFTDSASVDKSRNIAPESLLRVLAWSTHNADIEPNGSETNDKLPTTVRVHRLTILSNAKPGIFRGVVSHGAPGEPFGEVDLNATLNDRLDNRLLDVRVAATNAIFRLSSGVHELAVQYMSACSFHFVPTPTLINYEFPGEEWLQFGLPYFHDRPAWLTQTGEVHLGMALSADLERVYDLHTVFRREEEIDSRHLTEFTMLEAVFNLKNDWLEILDFAEGLLIFLVQTLQERDKYLSLIHTAQTLYPMAGTLKLGLNAEGKLLRLTFVECKKILREALKMQSEDKDDLTTAEEAALGRYLASEASEYAPPTDLFVVTNFPRHLRSFSVHPSAQNDSESFDVILRGQEIITGCRLINEFNDLRRAMTTREHPIDPDCDGWRPYVQSHEIGMPPWGGFGLGMNRFVQGLVGLTDIRETVLFPRDAKRLSP